MEDKQPTLLLFLSQSHALVCAHYFWKYKKCKLDLIVVWILYWLY